MKNFSAKNRPKDNLALKKGTKEKSKAKNSANFEIVNRKPSGNGEEKYLIKKKSGNKLSKNQID